MVKSFIVMLAVLVMAGHAHAGEYGNYLMHASPSKDLEGYLSSAAVSGAYDAGPMIRGANDSALVWLRGTGTPPQSPGIVVLGNGYGEIFGNSGKKGVYSSVYGRSGNDAPRPFNAFAGCEKEMGL
jgi:hypothetical protein